MLKILTFNVLSTTDHICFGPVWRRFDIFVEMVKVRFRYFLDMIQPERYQGLFSALISQIIVDTSWFRCHIFSFEHENLEHT